MPAVTATVARRRWANSSAPRARALGRITANSSPPTRYARSVARWIVRIAAAVACSRSSPAWWPRLSLIAFSPSRSSSTSASGSPVRPTRCKLACEVLLERAVVAQPGERVGDRDMGQARDLAGPRGVKAAAEAHEDQREAGEQGDADGERDRDRAARVRQVLAQRRAVLQRLRGRLLRLLVDHVLEHAEDRIDHLVVEVLDAGRVFVVDRAEQREARGLVAHLEVQQAVDGRAARGRVEPHDAAQVGLQAVRRLLVREPDGVGALEAVAALDRLGLRDPVARVLVRGAQARRRVRALGLAGDAILRDDRKAGEEAEHAEQARDARAHHPFLVRAADCHPPCHRTNFWHA